MPFDSNGNEYEEDAGSTSPVDDRCSALLTNWRERYDEKRYCTRLPMSTFVDDVDHEFCKVHCQRADLRMQARELFEHGLHSKSVAHFYDKLSPFKKTLGWAFYDSLLHESTYEFAPEYSERSFDFSGEDETVTPPMVDDDEMLTIDVPSPTQNHDPSSSLWLAAMIRVMQLRVQAIIAENDLQSKELADSTYIMPSEDNPNVEEGWRELEQWSEHHLNLPFDRLIRSHDDLLERGGVGVEDVEDEAQPDTEIRIFNDPTDTEGVDPETLLDEDSADIPIADPKP